MAIMRSLRSHLDMLVAILLAAAFVAELSLAEPPTGEPLIADLAPERNVAIAACLALLLSLAARQRVPLLPMGLAYVALALLGRGPVDASLSLVLGLVLACYSVGAWAGGRSGQLGGVLVGGLAGLAVVRADSGLLEPRDVAVPVLLLVGAWLVGLAARSIRAARGDERVVGALDWEADAAAPDSPGRDDTVRALRDVIERAMSAVIIQARTARLVMRDDPARVDRALVTIDAAATDALEETQRLTGLLLAPGGTPTFETRPGLGDLDVLAEQVTAAGLPVDMRVEGRPLPLTPDLDGVAYQVVYEALMATLYHATSATSRVVVRYDRDALVLEITDDGLALEDGDADQETAGLVAVRGEVAALGGSLDAGPGPERGYWVVARLPYEPDWE